MVLAAPAEPLQATELPNPAARAAATCCCACAPAGSAAPTCTCATASSSRAHLPLVLGHQIVGGCRSPTPPDARDRRSHRRALARLDLRGVPLLPQRPREPLRTARASPARTSTAATPSWPPPTRASASRSAAADYPDLQVAPLLCAGLIGHRALRMAGDAERIGLYGFGASAHIVCQVAVHQGRDVYAFTRPGDDVGQTFARALGAVWAGDADERPPEPLDAAIVFAPAGPLVPIALRALAPGGTVVCAGIHMSDIPSFPYEDLWHERSIRSVANLTRADGTSFLALAPQVPVRTTVTTYALEQAEQALADLRAGAFEGAAVLTV